MVLRWHGGDHTALKRRVKLNARGRSYNPVTDDLIALVRELARLMPDRQIARLLNRIGTQMATGKAWTEQSVHGFRKHRDIAAYRDGEWADRGEITLEATAKIIGVCKMTALRMLRRGDIKGRQNLSGRAMGDQGGRPGLVLSPTALARAGNTKWRAAGL